jgi:hypothetical protein
VGEIVAKKSYVVVRHDEQFITLSPFGSISRRLADGAGETTIARSAITAIARKMAVLIVSTLDGNSYEVMLGARREQKELVKAAFRL